MTPQAEVVARTMTLSAGLAAALLMFGLPAAFFSIGYEYILGTLDTQAEVSARDAGRLVFANPTMWVYEQVRLAELLERRASSGVPEARRIRDSGGRVVAESVDQLAPPVLARRHPIVDAVGVIAEVEVSRSLRPLVLETGAALGVGTLVAILIVVALRTIPLRAIRRALRSQEESERRYRSLYESMREGMALHRIVRDTAGRGVSLEVVDVNPACARMLGREEGKLLGEDLATVLGGALGTMIPRMLLGEGAHRSDQFELSLPESGRVLSVSVFSPRAGYVATLFDDVTEQRQLREHLAHSQKLQAIGRLAGGVAHDFNNILTVILSYAGALGEALRGEEREHAEEIRKAAQRAASLTRQLLAFSRKQVLHPQVLDVAETVTGLGRMLERLIGEHIKMTLELEAGLGCIEMDPTQFEQVVVNLAVNARDAMPGGGSLVIRARQAEAMPAAMMARGKPGHARYVVLTVSDTGTGMDEATLGRIFEPFFSTKPKGRGTGLGLPMVFAAVEQGGGFIDVASQPGVGSTFNVHLPSLEHPAGAASAQPEVALAPGHGGGGGRILVVDDEPQVRAAVRLFLEAGGYTVVEAASGEEGLGTFRADVGAFGLVLTDLVMPGMSGLALGRALQTCRPVPILYMSGYSEEVVSGQETVPAESFLQKPFERAALLGSVRAALASTGARSER